MKLFVPLFSFTLLLFTLMSCGKEAKIRENKSQDSIKPTIQEIDFKVIKELDAAFENQDLERFKKVFQQNPRLDINQIHHETGETLLTHAIKHDLREFRDYLIMAGIHLEKVNVKKETPLMVAAFHKRENSVSVLLSHNVDVDKKDNQGDTALHTALKKGSDDIALLLIRHGANVHILDNDKKSALILAEEINAVKSIDRIKQIMNLEAGAPTISEFRNLIISVDHKQLTEVLSRYPKMASERAYQDINPLALLVDHEDAQNALRTAEILINYDADIDGPKDAEITPLIKAVKTNKKIFVALFLASRANTEVSDKEGKRAIIHAIETNRPDLVEMLVNYSASFNYQFPKDGSIVTYDGCDIVKTVRKTLHTEIDKIYNSRIRRKLQCSFLDWVF